MEPSPDWLLRTPELNLHCHKDSRTYVSNVTAAMINLGAKVTIYTTACSFVNTCRLNIIYRYATQSPSLDLVRCQPDLSSGSTQHPRTVGCEYSPRSG